MKSLLPQSQDLYTRLPPKLVNVEGDYDPDEMDKTRDMSMMGNMG
jgi:hypothetical protein